MRIADLVGLALSALYQQKVRTGLTALGVVIGSVVLVLSLSVGQGVQDMAMRELNKQDQLRTIRVWPGHKVEEADLPGGQVEVKGQMSEERRERLRQAILRRWHGPTKRNRQRPLTPVVVRELAAIDHVVGVVPAIQLQGRAVFRGRAENLVVVAGSPEDRGYRGRVVAGSHLKEPRGRGVVVSEYLLYRWGVVNEADVDRVLGEKLRLEFRPSRPSPGTLLFLLNAGRPRLKPAEEKVLEKVIDRLPQALDKFEELSPEERELLRGLLRTSPKPTGNRRRTVVEELTIAGVLRDRSEQEMHAFWAGLHGDPDLLVPYGTSEELLQQLAGPREPSFSHLVVSVDHEDNVRAVHQRIAAMGLEPYSLVEVVDQVRFNVLLISFATAFVALVALVVAGLGITNTMLMSVLERTHEIGVMKAVGARDRHVQWIFLVEGTLIGLFGGLVGLGLGWLASIPGDGVARRLAEKQTHTHIEESLFAFPLWLTLGVPLFVSVLTMLAAVYPARRASRINPIAALRHE